jgi:hypothetical protein
LVTRRIRMSPTPLNIYLFEGPISIVWHFISHVGIGNSTYMPFTIILNTQRPRYFLLDWRQVLSYDVSFLNIRIVVNSVINLVNKNLPRTALQISVLFQLQFYDHCS